MSYLRPVFRPLHLCQNSVGRSKKNGHEFGLLIDGDELLPEKVEECTCGLCLGGRFSATSSSS